MRGTLEVPIRQARTPEHGESRIKEAIGTVDRLDGLLDRLLELARLDTGNAVVSMQPVPLHHAVSGAHEATGPGKNGVFTG
ncbi:MAG: hypothetical protein IPO17_01055 [Flavobacteriales bacterium]|nr:hypothetical protein [Flavobacteriales bacterium]